MLSRAFPCLLLLTACGVSVLDGTIPAAPSITAFTATPAALAADGGTTTLMWTVSDTTTLSLEPGVGDVSGFSGKAVELTTTTTFTLKASSYIGQVTATLTVPVGP
jgi:hypothetical protein